MTPWIKICLCDDEKNKFFGPGPYSLLCGIEKLGSLRAAAQNMGMAYSKALSLLRRAEEQLGFPLTSRTIGGPGGGGSVLTDNAKELMKKYAEYEAACRKACSELFEEYFPKQR